MKSYKVDSIKHRNVGKYLVIFIALVLFAACGDGLEEKIISSYAEGNPSEVEFYKWVGDRQVKVKHIRYYPNGEKQEEGGFVDDQRDGKWLYWHENGKLWSEGYFKKGQKHGKTTIWYKSGKMQYTGFYSDDKTDGTWIFYDGEGNPIKEVEYKLGEKISEKNLDLK